MTTGRVVPQEAFAVVVVMGLSVDVVVKALVDAE